MIKNLIVLASVFLGHHVLFATAECSCEPFNRVCTHACVKTMANCVVSCDTENMDACVDHCFNVYWPIVKHKEESDGRELVAERRSTIPAARISRRGHHEADQVDEENHDGNMGRHDESYNEKEHANDGTNAQNESPVKVYTTVTSSTTIYSEPTQGADPRPSETPANGSPNEGEKEHKGDTSMAASIAHSDFPTLAVMISTVVVGSSWLFIA